MKTIARRVARWLLSPANLTRRLRRELLVQRFRARVVKLPAVQLERGGDIAIHMLFGRRRLHDGIAAVKSFYRFAPTMYPLVVHDDGTMRPADVAFLERHLPGVRVILRAEADARVDTFLRAAKLPRCAALRSKLVLSLKYFDLQLFSEGKSVLYFDNDVLFHRPPNALLAALAAAPASWIDRYNVDIHTAYTWAADDVQRATGVTLLPSVNSGLMCVRRERLDWTLAEECLSLGQPAGSLHFAEQTLWALDLSRRGAHAFPPDYDVCFRHVWTGPKYDTWLDAGAAGRTNVASQHYCGGDRQRDFFYRDFLRAAHAFTTPAAAR